MNQTAVNIKDLKTNLADIVKQLMIETGKRNALLKSEEELKKECKMSQQHVSEQLELHDEYDI